MKATLQLDPSLDVVANRLPNAFVQRHRAVAQVRRLAAGLDQRGALVLFPEGGNWTPLRWRRAIARLWRQRRDDLAERAVAMPNAVVGVGVPAGADTPVRFRMTRYLLAWV